MFRIMQQAFFGEKDYVQAYRRARTDVKRREIVTTYLQEKLAEHKPVDRRTYVLKKTAWLKDRLHPLNAQALVDEIAEEILNPPMSPSCVEHPIPFVLRTVPIEAVHSGMNQLPPTYTQPEMLNQQPPPAYADLAEMPVPVPYSIPKSSAPFATQTDSMVGCPAGLRSDQFQRLVNIAKHYDTEFTYEALCDLSQFSQRNYDIVIIADDSKSNNIRDVVDQHGQPQRRWDEQRQRMCLLVEIAEVLDIDSKVDLYPLNQEPRLGITAHEVQQWYHTTEPHGEVTPIRVVLSRVMEHKRKMGERAVILAAIDGSPTDTIADIAPPGYVPNAKYLRRGDDGSMVNTDPALNPIPHLRKLIATRGVELSPGECVQEVAEQFPISIIACTGDEKTMQFLNDWDRHIPFVDVVDDYESERRECAAHGRPLSMGNYVVKCLVGSTLSKYDLCDESPRSRK